jgi:hypothetical protein
MASTTTFHHTIFLLPSGVTDIVQDTCTNKGIIILDKESFKESASNSLFNDSKFEGVVAQTVATSPLVLIPNAHQFISKKGALTLKQCLSSRIPGTNKNSFKFMMIADTVYKKGSPEEKLQCWINNAANGSIITTKQFESINTPTSDLPSYSLKLTCGLLAKFNQTDVGHITRAFGITSDEEQVLEQTDASHINKVYNGELINLEIADEKTKVKKQGGQIMFVKELGKVSHITINTSIKSVLSGAVIEKYIGGITSFGLQEIDSVAKQNHIITVTKVDGEHPVTVTGWYSYALDQFHK